MPLALCGATCYYPSNPIITTMQFDRLDVMEDSPEFPMDRDAHIAQSNAMDNPDIVISYITRWGIAYIEGCTTLGDSFLGIADGQRLEYRFDVDRRCDELRRRAEAAGLSVMEHTE